MEKKNRNKMNKKFVIVILTVIYAVNGILQRMQDGGSTDQNLQNVFD